MAPYEASKLAKSFVSRPEHQRMGVAAVVASFLMSLVFFSLLDPYMNTIELWTVGAKSSLSTAINATAAINSTSVQVPSAESSMSSAIITDAVNRNSTSDQAPAAESSASIAAADTNSSTVKVPADKTDVPTTTRIDTPGNTAGSETKTRSADGNGAVSISHQTNLSGLVVSDASLPATTTSTSRPSQEGRYHRHRPVCDLTDKRSDVCEIDEGPIMINGNLSRVVFYTAVEGEALAEWRIRPYARKGDGQAMSGVREVVVKAEPWTTLQASTSSTEAAALTCSVNHSVPAVVFSTRGYAGNLFHDFTDVIVPLFLTARRYGGEVQLLAATGPKMWWVRKYQRLLSALSNYDVIDYDRDQATRCFPRVTVGLHCHKELNIVPSRSPEGYSMPDFTRFLRKAYALDRHEAIRLEIKKKKRKPLHLAEGSKKPRLFLISRKRTRAWVNVGDVVRAAEELGYKVVTAEADVSTNVTSYAYEVNSCDVLLGVHGAGLTNLVFLPPGGVVIQVVPWGGLDWLCRYDFGYSAVDMGLSYLQYSITPEESSLLGKYPRDHPIFNDPLSFHKNGWNAMRAVFLDQQNVKIDVRRFKGVLRQALELLGPR